MSADPSRPASSDASLKAIFWLVTERGKVRHAPGEEHDGYNVQCPFCQGEVLRLYASLQPVDPPKEPIAQVLVRLKDRIGSLVSHGEEICPDWFPTVDGDVSCERCGYSADTHLIRDVLRVLLTEERAPKKGNGR